MGNANEKLEEQKADFKSPPFPHHAHTHTQIKIKLTITSGEFSDKLSVDMAL